MSDDGLKTYHVKCRGQVEETYVIDAVSEEDAMNRWFDGDLLISEAWDVGPESVQVADE